MANNDGDGGDDAPLCLRRRAVNGANNDEVRPVYFAVAGAGAGAPAPRFLLEVAAGAQGGPGDVHVQLSVVSRRPRKPRVRITYTPAFPEDATLQTVENGCRLDTDLLRGATGPDDNTGHMVRACLVAAMHLWPALQRVYLRDQSVFTCVTPPPVETRELSYNMERDVLLHGAPWYSRALGAVPCSEAHADGIRTVTARLAATPCCYASFEELWAALGPAAPHYHFYNAAWLRDARAAAAAAFPAAGTAWSVVLRTLFAGDGAVARATTVRHACSLFALLEANLVTVLRVSRMGGGAEWVVSRAAVAAYTDDVTMEEVPKPAWVGGRRAATRRRAPAPRWRTWVRL